MSTTFIEPKPNYALMHFTTIVNRMFILKGLPLIRHIPGLRPLTKITKVDFPKADRDVLRAHIGAKQATFITPNHPEFFTDWMIDKEILSRVAPRAASWAAGGIVNGAGQGFWLRNNLIAQLPGAGIQARRHSVAVASKGHGVLLHPEGRVGWHNDYVGQLFPGAISMAQEALKEDTVAEAWVTPVIWKMRFNHDVTKSLFREYAYICKRLEIDPLPGSYTPAQATHHLYDTLTTRYIERWRGQTKTMAPDIATRWRKLSAELMHHIALVLELEHPSELEALIAGRRWLRRPNNKQHGQYPRTKLAIELLEKLQELGPFAWRSRHISQEEVAEHLKRVRAFHCKGTWKDTLNAFVPRAVGTRSVYVRAVEPLAVHAVPDTVTTETVRDDLRSRMQHRLDTLNAELDTRHPSRVLDVNPFYA